MEGALTAGFVRDHSSCVRTKGNSLLLPGVDDEQMGSNERRMAHRDNTDSRHPPSWIRARPKRSSDGRLRACSIILFATHSPSSNKVFTSWPALNGDRIRQLPERRRSVGRRRCGGSPCTEIAGSQEAPRSQRSASRGRREERTAIPHIPRPSILVGAGGDAFLAEPSQGLESAALRSDQGSC